MHGRIITERETADVTGRDTIPNLFDLIQEYLQQPHIVASCTFHTELGAPLIYSHVFAQASDTDYGFSVSDLEILEN